MIFDTDIIVWSQRGNIQASNLIDSTEERYLSTQSLMELLQGAEKKSQQEAIKDFLAQLDFLVLPLTEDIGHRALVYIEVYGLSNGLRAGDALIAATSVENNLTLATSNRKHFKSIRELKLKLFKP